MLPAISFSEEFQDLNFETANVSNPDSLHRVPLANAFPNWHADASMSYFAGTAEPHVFVGIGLDNIEFSATSIPEPASKQILAVGLGCFCGFVVGRRLWRV